NKDKFIVLFETANNLAEKLKRLSEAKISSIILIDSKPISDPLKKVSIQDLHLKNILHDDARDMAFLNAIKSNNDMKHLNINDIDYYLMESISSIDGAIILDSLLNIISFGEVINMQKSNDHETYGTGTKAAKHASNYCLAIKISEDGDIYFYANGMTQLTI
ncbi:diadenylate cyclase, partial [Bacillus subtilis]|uniref:diadenylate cyclase n=1 Tax=Bacillus subtilis TaxID=1423 RepID=UPI00227E40E4